MLSDLWAYKGHILFIRDASANYDAAKNWASAGYNGWPAENRHPWRICAKPAVPCPLAYGSRGTQTGDFHVNWYPHGWSSGAGPRAQQEMPWPVFWQSSIQPTDFRPSSSRGRCAKIRLGSFFLAS